MIDTDVQRIKQLIVEDIMEETDDPEIRFEARHALQHLVNIQDRLQTGEKRTRAHP